MAVVVEGLVVRTLINERGVAQLSKNSLQKDYDPVLLPFGRDIVAFHERVTVKAMAISPLPRLYTEFELLRRNFLVSHSGKTAGSTNPTAAVSLHFVQGSK